MKTPPLAPLSAYEHLQRARERRSLAGLLSPGLAYLLLFFALPLLVILVYSFLSNSPRGAIVYQFTLDNYRTILTESLYVNAYLRSLWSSLLTTLICLLIGYPLAVFIARAPQQWRTPLLLLILIPFWTNFLVRIYAWQVILANNGILNSLLQLLGLPEQHLLNTDGSTLVGLVYGELPFMILPLYAAVARFDFTLLEAASDLGANRIQSFLRVMLPMTMPGVISGSVLIFIPTLGQFVVSDLLGGSKVDYLGSLIQRLYLRANPINWPLGSAMAVLMMLVLLIAIMLYFRAGANEEER